MTANINTTSEFSLAAQELCRLLQDNYIKFHTNGAYAVGFHQRETIIKEVLASDGGKDTIDQALKYIDSKIQPVKDAKARSDADDKKHPFLNFFKRQSEDKKFYRTHDIGFIERIQEEISTIYRAANVIELSGFANKPKVG